MDIYGKVILAKNYDGIQGEFKTSLDVAEIKKGIYFVRITDENMDLVERIVVE